MLAISATAPEGWALHPSIADLDIPSSYTNYGQSAIHFAAPGGDADLPGEDLCTISFVSDYPCWVFDMVLAPTSEGWHWAKGTSMAAPHVAGVAALVIGQHGGSLSPAAVAQTLRHGADDLGKPGQDDFHGAGRVNALGSLQ